MREANELQNLELAMYVVFAPHFNILPRSKHLQNAAKIWSSLKWNLTMLSARVTPETIGCQCQQ